VSDEKILAVRDWRSSPLFDERERLVLELADAMTQVPARIPDALYARLRAAFAPPELVELSATIAWENYRSRFNRAFEVASEGYAEGAVCALPAAPPPPNPA
jgi:alkylhydroperoxidase family enzyme